jgi:predicted RNA binding protein YcfA (HicA-like mRNA interferase family)
MPSRREKLRAKIERGPRHVRFEDLSKLLQRYGFEMYRPSSGSHFYYVRGRYQISVPYRRPHVLPIYVKRALALIDQAESEEDGNG